MNKFYWKALNAKGELQTGESQAESSSEVFSALRQKGYFPTYVDSCPERYAVAANGHSAGQVIGAVLGGLIISGIIIFLRVMIGCGSTHTRTNSPISYSPSSASTYNDSSVAYSMSVLYVRSHLKSPSSAKFCGVNSASIEQSGDRATTRGWVDSQNSFGATIRTQWTCELHRTANGDYVVDSCVVSE